MATPAARRGKKKNYFVQIWGCEKLLENTGEIFLSGKRRASFFSETFRIVFRSFCVSHTMHRIELNFFGGNIVLQRCHPEKQALGVK